MRWPETGLTFVPTSQHVRDFAAVVGYALRGASYDRRDGRLELMLGAPGSGGAHLTHSIGDVTSIAVLTEPDQRDRALQARHGQGQTILTFRD